MSRQRRFSEEFPSDLSLNRLLQRLDAEVRGEIRFYLEERSVPMASVPVASPDRIAGGHLQVRAGHGVLDARLPAPNVRGHESLVR